MAIATTIDRTRTYRTARVWLGVALIVVGFLGHFFAAQAIGGTYVAFRDHIFGFVMILVVTSAIIAFLGWRFWKRRPDITVLAIGIVQALSGLAVYITRYHVHG
jgi:cell division protein FtsW (lipid II flippase)